jgi:hypothetical protein
MKSQRGMSFFGLIIMIAFGISLVLIGVKLVPPYIEYFTVKKILGAIAADPAFSTMTPQEIRTSFERRAAIDYQNAVNPQDLDITKVDGETVISVEYSQKIFIAGNVSACLDFEASTAGKKSKPLTKE